MNATRTRTRCVALATAALLAGGCSIPEPQANAEAIASIDRDQAYVQGEAHTGVVSYLHAGTPRVARVIFVHGTPGDATGWADFLLDVPHGQEYIAPDRPGFGASRPDGAVVSMQAQAAALRPFLETDTGVPLILVGHSRGAAVIAEAALRYPERVAGLVMVAGALDPGLEDPHWIRPLGRYPPLSWFLPRSLANANRESLAYAGELRRLEPRLRRIDQPVRIIHGVQDERVPFANVAFMRKRLSGARLGVTRLENAGHSLPWTASSIVQTEINTLVARICGGLRECERGRGPVGDAR